MDTRNANPQKNPWAGLLYIPSGVHDKTLLIADPARQTGWNLTGGSPQYLSYSTAPKGNLALSGSGLTQIKSTEHTPSSRTEGGAFGIGSMGLGGTHTHEPFIVANRTRIQCRAAYVA